MKKRAKSFSSHFAIWYTRYDHLDCSFLSILKTSEKLRKKHKKYLSRYTGIGNEEIHSQHHYAKKITRGTINVFLLKKILWKLGHFLKRHEELGKICIIFYSVAIEAWNEWVSKSKVAISHKITIFYLYAKVYQ